MENERSQPDVAASASSTVHEPQCKFKFLLLTHKDTDILTLSSARQMLPLDFPPIETADLVSFKADTDMIGLLDEKARTAAQVVILVRLLGRGVRGFQHLLDYARKEQQDLIVVSGVPGSFEPDLTAMSTVSADTIHEVMRYFNADGPQHGAHATLPGRPLATARFRLQRPHSPTESWALPSTFRLR